tara:strand:+ start:2854 stop:3108 length:255 start_codon:yes stop_codon:yes gene_type:complete
MNKYFRSLEKIDKIAFVILAIFIVLIIIGCQYEPYEPACTKGESSDGVVCTEIYDPVCAPDGTEYPNSCYAEKDGWDNSCLVKC